jgi:arginine utilization protein RocB
MQFSNMTRNSPELSARAREIALELTSWPSVTGTPEEAIFSERLVAYLRQLGFADSWKEAIPGEESGRSNVFVLKRGTGPRTIVLAGHFDTVPFDDYGDLAALALHPVILREAMIAKLEVTGENALALADLKSGDFLPGRGLLDMKSGVAAGLAAMEAYQGEHSLLFVATPDEEDRSAGMRAAAPLIAEIAKTRGLQVELVINLDATSDQGDGAAGRVAAMGSIGKQLLTAFVVGKEAHACYPQDGANSAYIAAELVTEFELAPELAETSGDEIAATPTALHLKDLKAGYNVTTPAQSFVYWNTLQHRRSAAEVLEISMKLAKRAAARAKAKLKRNIPVMAYAELKALASQEKVLARAQELAKRNDLDLPERTKLLTQYVWSLTGLSGPAVVMGLGSIPYSAVSLKNERLGEAIAEPVKSFGLGTIGYFPGISDMSFVGEASGDFSAVADNTPIWGTSFTLAEPAGYPCINIGPWGRDYHHWLERLHAPYAFETLPKVLIAVIDAVFKRG